MAVLAGTDFFTVEVLTWRGLEIYSVLFFLHLETRRVTIAGITDQPEEGWMQGKGDVLLFPCGAVPTMTRGPSMTIVLNASAVFSSITTERPHQFFGNRVFCNRLRGFRDGPVQSRKTLLTNLPPLRFSCVQLGSVPELASAKVLGNRANSLFHVVPVQVHRLPVHVQSP